MVGVRHDALILGLALVGIVCEEPGGRRARPGGRSNGVFGLCV